MAHRSWATAPEAAITSPATTARIVAKATAEMIATNRSPPTVPAPPPSSSASSGVARLPPALASTASCPSSARAPTPMNMVMMKNMPISRTAQPIEERAAFASGTVKKRISMCGSPAVPSSSASPNEMPLIALGNCWPLVR